MQRLGLVHFPATFPTYRRVLWQPRLWGRIGAVGTCFIGGVNTGMLYTRGCFLLLIAVSWAVSGSNSFADASMDRVLRKLDAEERAQSLQYPGP